MRVPISWLNEYCSSGLSVDELASKLALTGTEVERVVRHGAPSPDNFVVGYVVSAEQHPDADRLKVCQVDVGEAEPVTIVCGAANVAAGQTVAVARPGAVMPSGDKLGKAKLRGVESFGMILAEDELAIGGDHNGIMVLNEELKAADGSVPAAGTALADVLLPGDDVLELEITPNRPDCLGVYGIAREVHALTGAALTSLPGDVETSGDEAFKITVEDHGACPRFTARVFHDITVGPSPLWLKARLSAAGMRPINNVVDVTNYVMLLTGQPMHAFDLDLIRGDELIVRAASDGEKLTTLDGIERECDAQMVLVCDGEGPTAIAGIMGGAVSEVSATTTRVLLEVASWNGPNIHKTSQKLALRSEASSRFEKGLSVHLPLEAQQLASRLLVELCGATLMSGTIDVHGDLAQPEPILLRAASVEGLLGVPIPAAECATTLERLDFTVEADADDLWVTPPHVRMLDVTREADVIEEIARFCVNDLPATLPAARSAVGSLTHGQKLRRRIEDLCSDRGYYEAITYSFTSRELLAKLSPDGSDDYADALPIANPLSEEHAVMRPLVLPGLLDAAQRNFARGATSVRLFEQGKVYGGTLEAPTEHIALGLLISGPATPKTWRTAATDSDFFVLKALIEAITALASSSDIGLTPRSDLGASLHPVRQAAITDGSGASIGWVGELHPLVARAFDLGQTVVAEINVDALTALGDATAIFQPFSEFPSIIQDIAVVVKLELSEGESRIDAEKVMLCIKDAGGELLKKISLFDSYDGEQVGEGKVSLAIRLEFSSLDRTLTDDDVTAARAAITKKLDEIGGSLRA